MKDKKQWCCHKLHYFT